MDLLDWYLQKADQCERSAKSALDPGDRAQLEDSRQAWLRIAEERLRDLLGKTEDRPKYLM
jgi:hypothetical protein